MDKSFKHKLKLRTPSKISTRMNASDMFADQNLFKVEETRVNDQRAAPPECILAIKPPNPERKPLNDKELGEAKMKLWNNKFIDLKFPRERKFRVDPQIAGQTIGIVSFVPAPGAIPDKQGCFGVVKLRGNFANQYDAERYGAMLMKKYDSFCEYDLVRVGQEFPLMIDNSVYVEETKEINIKAIVDDVSLSFINKKKQEERQQREEVEERHRRLVSKDSSEDKMEATTDLEFYTQLRTKKAHCQYVIDQCNIKLKEAQEALANNIKEIEELDAKFPSYKHDYIAQYDKGLKAIGVDKANENPLIKYMKEDNEAQQASYSKTLSSLSIKEEETEEKKE